MRHPDRKSAEKLGHLLRQSFATKRRIEFNLSESWLIGVMSEIRRIGPLNAKIEYWALFEKMIWRFIPAAVALVLILGVALTQIDVSPENLIADIYAEESIDTGLYGFYDQRGSDL